MSLSNVPDYIYQRPPEIELIRSMIRDGKPAPQTPPAPQPDLNDDENKGAFIIKPAAQWLTTAGTESPSQMLFGEFWCTGELCFMFADTNVGKSILAVQMGDSISSGNGIPGISTRPPAGVVLYFDFELSTKQFEDRYHCSNNGNYAFSPNFYRVVFNPLAQGAHKFASHTDYLINALENAIITYQATTVIIDNITCLRTGTESAATAIALMRSLKDIKTKYNLSVLVLAHTPKRNTARPITRNDLQGSKMLINFADSAFAIGESQTLPGTRYIKQIKQRYGHEAYGSHNVCLCRIERPHNFLKFVFTGNGAETNHLMHYNEQQRKTTEQRVIQLQQNGFTIRQIADDLGMSHSSVFRMVKRLGKDKAT